MAILGDLNQTKIIMPYDGEFFFSPDVPLEEAIQQIIRRHPMQETEIVGTLNERPPGEVRQTLLHMQDSGLAYCVPYRGRRFWRFRESKKAIA